MKKTYKIKKSVLESMVDDAIRSMALRESSEDGSYEDYMNKERGFNYDDLSQDVMHWALNYADSGHNQPINAIQSMREWYLGDDNALDMVCDKFAEWKGIECDDNVRNAVEKAANQIGYYENWNEDRIGFNESEQKQAQAIEDLKKQVKSVSQKVSDAADEELPELRQNLDSLKNKLSSMKEDVGVSDCPMYESFKSQKLKDFARKHGGLTNGKWSAEFENDLYNMSDEDFDTYVPVDKNTHYRRYGINGWDKEANLSNNNFQPIEFNDGTFMVRRDVSNTWDDRALNKIQKHRERSDARKNDGKSEYQFENPHLNKLFNQGNYGTPRGKQGYPGDANLTKNNINMNAVRFRNSLEGDGNVVDNARTSRNVMESNLKRLVSGCLRSILNEGIYGYPDTIDDLILLSENDRELYEMYEWIAKAVANKYAKDVEITVERLVDSSIMKKYQQAVFRKYGREQKDLDRMRSPRLFRQYVANKIVEDVKNGLWNENLNEDWGRDDRHMGSKLNESENREYGYQNVSDEFVDRVGENGYEVWVPDYCLPYLVNGDTDIYDEDEIAEMQAFEKRFEGKLLKGMNAGDFCIPKDGESPSLVGKNDVFPKDMGAECYKFFLPLENTETMNEAKELKKFDQRKLFFEDSNGEQHCIYLYTTSNGRSTTEHAECPDDNFVWLHGSYKYVNRPWQCFDYEKAVQQLIQQLPENWREGASQVISQL